MMIDRRQFEPVVGENTSKKAEKAAVTDYGLLWDGTARIQQSNYVHYWSRKLTTE
jgi:hypothetical protein